MPHEVDGFIAWITHPRLFGCDERLAALCVDNTGAVCQVVIEPGHEDLREPLQRIVAERRPEAAADGEPPYTHRWLGLLAARARRDSLLPRGVAIAVPQAACLGETIFVQRDSVVELTGDAPSAPVRSRVALTG